MGDSWRFDDPPESASFTTKFVLNGSPILRVYHDYGGGWQFHGSPEEPSTTDVARLVSLGSMVAGDATLNALNDLPEGWRAVRASAQAPWERLKNHPFATYAGDGYYLEDAVWMAQFRDDVHPPAEALRENLATDTYVKLLFRFAAENAERQDGQTERMWVLITGFDEDDNYLGTLENDPHHAGDLAQGEVVVFHSRHVMEIHEADDA